MANPVTMPQLGLTMQTGIVEQWLKQVGDYVEKGEPLVEVTGDKVTLQLESPYAGYLKKILVEAGIEVPVQTVLAYLGAEDAELWAEESAALQSASEALPASTAAAGDAQARVPAVARPGRVKASPVAKRLAAELGIDLATVLPTGPDGLISGDDVRAAHHAKDRPVTAANEIKLSAVKKVVAERMKSSYLDAPHIHLTLACDMSEAVRLREQANRSAAADCHVTFTDIVAWAVAGALVKHPLLNATLRDDCIVLSPGVNVGIAADTERGLVVPVVKHADRLSLLELSRARSALVDRVRGGKQTTDDLEGGTFTVTNLGMYGIQAFDPIIAPGQAGILGVGEVALTPVADEAGVRAVPLMRLTLACDHRIADGADGAKFLAAVKARLEHPSL